MAPMYTALEEAAKAAEASKFSIVLMVVASGVKVWAPRYGCLTSEWIVGWHELESAEGNPLLQAVAKVEASL